MSNRSNMGVGDKAEAHILRPGKSATGVKFHNWADVIVYKPAIFETRTEVEDCYGVRCKPGQLVKTWKKEYGLYRADGMVRSLRQAPSVKMGASGHNLVVNAGLDDVLDVYLDNQSQTTTWYVGLTDDTPSPAAADVMNSHAGWTEFTEYSETVRQTWTGGAASSQSIDNSGNTADFSINNDTNGGLGGVFLVSNNTKGGTTGTLFSCVALTGGNRVVGNGDTVQATYTFTAADDGS